MNSVLISISPYGSFFVLTRFLHANRHPLRLKTLRPGRLADLVEHLRPANSNILQVPLAHDGKMTPGLAVLPPGPDACDHNRNHGTRRTRAHSCLALMPGNGASAARRISRQACAPPGTARARVRPRRSRNIP